MKEGAMELYEGDRAWHILRLLQIIQSQAPPFEKVKDRIRREYVVRQVNNMAGAWLAELHERVVVVENLSTSPEQRSILGQDVAAYVNGEPISVSELGQALVARFGQEMLRPYIERRLVLQEAREQDVTVSDKAVEARLKEFRNLLPKRQDEDQRLQPPGEALDQEPARKPDRDAVRATMLAEKLVGEGVQLSREELQQGYEKCTGESFTIREIVTDSEAAARRLLARLQRGAGVGLLLRTESTAPAPWLNLGVTRDIRKGHAYFQHLADKDAGDFLYFQQDDGYHVVRVLAREEPSSNDKPSFARFRKEQKQLKIHKRAKAWIEKLRASADIEVNL
jgi:parvulin-like peptidyl-prolyl isomerase